MVTAAMVVAALLAAALALGAALQGDRTAWVVAVVVVILLLAAILVVDRLAAALEVRLQGTVTTGMATTPGARTPRTPAKGEDTKAKGTERINP
jgi:hypothetical protein